jgi:hypothetical protein
MATPSAVSFIDLNALEKQTGGPVRSQHRAPDDPRSPKADAIIIAPATFNTINRLANGIADNYVLDVVNEAIGLGVPTVILPFVNSAYASRAPFQESVKKLQNEDVPDGASTVAAASGRRSGCGLPPGPTPAAKRTSTKNINTVSHQQPATTPALDSV